KNEQQILPLNKGKKSLILTPATIKDNTVTSLLNSFSDFLHGQLGDFTTLLLTPNENILQACEKAEQIIIPISGLSNDEDIQLVMKQILQQYSDKTIICAFGNPADLLEIQEAATLLLTYDESLMSMQAMAKVLLNN